MRGLLALTVVLAAPARTADWPQWGGPQRTGLSAESQWTTQWPAGGPKVLWRRSVGVGYASVAVCGGRLYTMGNRRGNDFVWCLDAASGRVVWTHSYPCRQGPYRGPRATPTVHGGRLYTLSRQGHAFCLRADSGEIVWRNDLTRSIGASVPRWGFAGSPLIEGRLVVLNAGTAGAALDKDSGRVVWHTGRERAGYASPVAFTAGGQRRIAIFAARAIVVLDARNGATLWQHPWRTEYDINAATPIILHGGVFVSSDYGSGCALLRIGSERPVVWHHQAMENHFSSAVLWEGHLYGFDGHAQQRTPLVCLDAATGREKWRHPGPRMGSLMIADGKIIALTGTGILFVAEASPEGYTELARAQVLRGTCWTVPVLAGGRIFCRSYRGDLVGLDVRPR